MTSMTSCQIFKAYWNFGDFNRHIDKFPKVMPAHWCRKDSSKHYLEDNLNKEIMYSLYLDFCKENNRKPVGKTFYKEKLFEKNVGFHTPKKDACWRYFYDKLSQEEKESCKKEFEERTRRKTLG